MTLNFIWKAEDVLSGVLTTVPHTCPQSDDFNYKLYADNFQIFSLADTADSYIHFQSDIST